MRRRLARFRARRSLGLLALVIVCAQAAGGDVVAREPAATQPVRPVPPQSAPVLSAMDRLAGPAQPDDLEVMTFNLRFGADTVPNSWAQRRPVMRALLTAERPDLIGTQEGLAKQLSDLGADLGADYDRIGTGRDGGGQGEHMAIFFDRGRLRPQESGHYWLSDQPHVPGSISWGSAHVRMVTWVLFTDLRTGRRFYAVNTHLDNRSENARRQAARLIMTRLAALEPLPVVLTGDFNSPAGPGSRIYGLLVAEAGLRDTWTAAPSRGPGYATIHNYRALIPDGERADWILTTPDIVTVAALVNTHRAGTQYPSDHLPVQTRLRLP